MRAQIKPGQVWRLDGRMAHVKRTTGLFVIATAAGRLVRLHETDFARARLVRDVASS